MDFFRDVLLGELPWVYVFKTCDIFSSGIQETCHGPSARWRSFGIPRHTTPYAYTPSGTAGMAELSRAVAVWSAPEYSVGSYVTSGVTSQIYLSKLGNRRNHVDPK